MLYTFITLKETITLANNFRANIKIIVQSSGRSVKT